MHPSDLACCFLLEASGMVARDRRMSGSSWNFGGGLMFDGRTVTGSRASCSSGFFGVAATVLRSIDDHETGEAPCD